MADETDPVLPPINRRRFLYGASGIAAASVAAKITHDWLRPTSPVFVAKAADYSVDIKGIVRRGLVELGISRGHVHGKSVMLKPNLVEPTLDAPHINTHPAFIREVAEAFQSLGAREVFVAEGPGHCRDTYLVLEESGVADLLARAKLEFVDLNHDEVDVIDNRVGKTQLHKMYLPRSLKRADLVVSLPKMKTHHWTGATLSMKNLFGLMPGICYGWPKNVLHREGIDQSVVDICGTVRPHLAIVDGIVAMEGDGPIMGDPLDMGVIVMGTQLPSVDASTCRLMRINPERIGYLNLASAWCPIDEAHIEQRGETIASLARTFHLLDTPELARFRS